MVSGTTEVDVGITLCVGATTATDPTCAGGIRHTADTATTTWSYTLTTGDISTIGDRECDAGRHRRRCRRQHRRFTQHNRHRGHRRAGRPGD